MESMTGVLARGEARRTLRWRREGRGGGWWEAAASRGVSAAPHVDSQEDPRREPPAGARPRGASIWGFWPSERGGSPCFESPVSGAVLQKPPGKPGQPPNPPTPLDGSSFPLCTSEPPPSEARLS